MSCIVPFTSFNFCLHHTQTISDIVRLQLPDSFSAEQSFSVFTWSGREKLRVPTTPLCSVNLSSSSSSSVVARSPAVGEKAADDGGSHRPLKGQCFYTSQQLVDLHKRLSSECFNNFCQAWSHWMLQLVASDDNFYFTSDILSYCNI